MAQLDEAFLKKLLAAFMAEAHEHLEEISEGLRELKNGSELTRTHWLETIFRGTHSLKGAARAVNKRTIETVCQAVESLFARLQKEQSAPSESMLEILYRALDLLEADLANPENTSKSEVDEIIASLEQIDAEKPANRQPSKTINHKPPVIPNPSVLKNPDPESRSGTAPAAPVRRQDTLRVSQERLEQVMRQSEEMLAFKLSTNHQMEALRRLSGKITDWKKSWTGIAPILRRLNQAADTPSSPGKTLKSQLSCLSRQLERIQEELDPLDLQIVSVCQHAQRDALSIGRFVDNLNDNMRGLLLMPFADSLSVLHKVVRDLSSEQQKQVELKISGGELEADRRILEGMKNSFLHLIRNSIDHGIENPEERLRKNKSAQGTIWISISRTDAGKVHIRIEDDGRGLDMDRIRQTLIKHQIASRKDVESRTEDQLAASIFLSGFSTLEKVTEISGRGMGMSVVREQVEAFNGRVSVTPRKPWGTSFSIILPVAVATFRGILVRLGDRKFILPTPAVEKMMRTPRNEIKTVENRNTINLAGQILPLEPLTGLLDLPSSDRPGDRDYLHALIVCSGRQRFALEVDEVLGEQEVLVKGLGPQLARVRNISGVAELGPGDLVPILNVHDLMNSAIHSGTSPASSVPITAAKERKSIMIAEDSITSRMLLKNVLESVGYRVAVAVDGASALAELKTGEFDALVSDVDMPRMNGFVLTERVRADRKLADLPVILITSLSSQDDKERGIEAGANAYIVKSSFDQSNLLSVLDRLMETE